VLVLAPVMGPVLALALGLVPEMVPGSVPVWVSALERAPQLYSQRPAELLSRTESPKNTTIFCFSFSLLFFTSGGGFIPCGATWSLPPASIFWLEHDCVLLPSYDSLIVISSAASFVNIRAVCAPYC